MRQVTRFIAEDGQEFLTESQCILHERRMALKKRFEERLKIDFNNNEGIAIREFFFKNFDLVRACVSIDRMDSPAGDLFFLNPYEECK